MTVGEKPTKLPQYLSHFRIDQSNKANTANIMMRSDIPLLDLKDDWVLIGFVA